MNVVHSSGWVEYFLDAPNADFFAEPILDVKRLIIPSVTIYEVYKRILGELGKAPAGMAVGQMAQARIHDLGASDAVQAATISSTTRLPMADAIILACAQVHDATLWTQDADFEGLPGVRYVPYAG